MNIFERCDERFLPGFERRFVTVHGEPVRVLVGGSGPPLLMLHGDPQTHLCWHAMAPRLAERRTVVLTDLHGRGESHEPPAALLPEGNAYSKRASAAEQLAVMRTLGFERFSLAGHDRGARVASRLALDHPDAVDALIIIDIAPASDFYDRTDAVIAQEYFRFFDAGRRIRCPTLVLWGERGVTGRRFDVPSIWEGWCDDVRFAPMPCGHFIPEEAPMAALAALFEFIDERM